MRNVPPAKDTIMRKTLAILAAAAAALTSTIGMAHAPEGQQRFTRDGQTYVYTAAKGTGAMQVIDGRSSTGSTFHLVVRGDRVSGTAGGMPVSFRLADVQSSAAGVEISAR